MKYSVSFTKDTTDTEIQYKLMDYSVLFSEPQKSIAFFEIYSNVSDKVRCWRKRKRKGFILMLDRSMIEV